ncbi:hypothetical protein ASG81_22835 [Paenibacillus sp. Soil522]|nr:hypothetical protein ASG81_22835 [Paenibacillus sp. Soil522]
MSALYPEKFIYDIAGFSKIRAQKLVGNFKEQMKVFEPTICLEESVEQIEKQVDDTFKITTNRDVHYSKSVIITAGNGAFQPRKLVLEDAVRFENSNIYYFVDVLR